MTLAKIGLYCILKHGICCLKNQLEDGEKNSDSTSMVNFYKFETFLLKDQNPFLKSELQQKQIIAEKFLDLQKDQLKINCSNSSRLNFHNEYFNKNVTLKNKNVETPEFKITRKTTFSTNKKKVIVVGDSVTRFLRSDEL